MRWHDLSDAIDYNRVFFRDGDPSPWRRSPRGTRLIRSARGEEVIRYDEFVSVMVPDISEPKDGTRLEFVHNTDVYGMWRDDASSAEAGYPVGTGGETWTPYPNSIPATWTRMLVIFGESLIGATMLEPVGTSSLG